MARKSRKNLMPQAAVQEAVQQNEKELLRTAAYARLSVENGGHETEDSLHTQILQIHNYIRENPELTLTDTYADNGFTGTRFDRPEFERMIQKMLSDDIVKMRRSQVRKSDLTRRLLSWGSCHWHSDQSEDDGSHAG